MSASRGGRRGLIVVAACLIAGGGYAWLTRFSRTVKDAATETVSDGDWELLRAHADDPRVGVAAIVELEAASASDCGTASQRLEKRLGTFLDEHPSDDDKSLDAVVAMVRKCGDVKFLKWTRRPPADVVGELHKHITERRFDVPGAALNALVLLHPPVTQAVIDVVVAQMAGTPGPADAYLAAGFPPDGEPFVASDAKVDRRPSATDPRVTSAFATWVGAFRTGGAAEDLAAFARAAPLVKLPALDEPMAVALANSGAVDGSIGPEGRAAYRAIIRPDDAALVRRSVQPEQAAKLLGHLGDASGAARVLANAAAGFRSHEDPERDAFAESQAEILANMGPAAVPALRAALADPELGTRSVAARAFARIDRHEYAKAIADQMRKSPSFNDADLAMKLLAGEPIELEPYFVAFNSGNDLTVANAGRFVTAHAKPDVWVPQLFANVPLDDGFSSRAVAAYTILLFETPGVGEPAARALDAELTRAGGAPSKVNWLTKKLALEALARWGTEADAPLVAKFVADTTIYTEVKTTTNRQTGATLHEERTQVGFSALASKTLAEVRARPSPTH